MRLVAEYANPICNNTSKYKPYYTEPNGYTQRIIDQAM